MTDPGREPGDAVIDGHVDEDAIRADERAKVEAELQSTSNPVARDDPVGEEQIHTGEVPTTHVDANAGPLTRARGTRSAVDAQRGRRQPCRSGPRQRGGEPSRGAGRRRTRIREKGRTGPPTNAPARTKLRGRVRANETIVSSRSKSFAPARSRSVSC